MGRFEDQGITLRLFHDEHDAKINGGALVVARYGPGVIGRDDQGFWIDAHGRLPLNWQPQERLIAWPEQHGFYVDDAGVICCADVPPRGCTFSFHKKRTAGTPWLQLWIVSEETGEVAHEFQLWPTLAALKQGLADRSLPGKLIVQDPELGERHAGQGWQLRLSTPADLQWLPLPGVTSLSDAVAMAGSLGHRPTHFLSLGQPVRPLCDDWVAAECQGRAL
jgi:hypothetical protein